MFTEAFEPAKEFIPTGFFFVVAYVHEMIDIEIHCSEIRPHWILLPPLAKQCLVDNMDRTDSFLAIALCNHCERYDSSDYRGSPGRSHLHIKKVSAKISQSSHPLACLVVLTKVNQTNRTRCFFFFHVAAVCSSDECLLYGTGLVQSR